MKNQNDPRVKMMEHGKNSLSDSELLSIFFRSDKLNGAHKLLAGADHNFNALAKMSVHEMMSCGVSEATATYVALALEMGRRRNFHEAIDNGVIRGSQDAACYIRPMIGDLIHEEFWIIYLNRRNAILCSEKLSQGGITGTVIDVRLVLKKALEKNATSLICCHNHPSGNLEPSEADKKITRQLKDAAALMEIPIIDHIIVSQTGNFSFADEGYL